MRWPRWIMRRWVGPRRARRTGVVNVKDFGAVGDGTTDDAKAFRAAMSYANRAAVGDHPRMVEAPRGEYRISRAGRWWNRG